MDKSGSMSGTPIEAVKKGALQIGKTIYDQNDFQYFIYAFYDHEAYSHEAKTYEIYSKGISSTHASGGTNFIAVFKYLQSFVESKNVSDLSVIFFTDG